MEFTISNIYGDMDEKGYDEILNKYHYDKKKNTIVFNSLEELNNFQDEIGYALIIEEKHIDIYDDWIG